LKVTLSAQQLHTACEYREFLGRKGFEFHVSDRRVDLLTLPTFQSKTFDAAGNHSDLYNSVIESVDFEELLFQLQDETADLAKVECKKIRYLLASKACRTAWMIGHALSVSDMRLVSLINAGYAARINTIDCE
jgi:DNA mismatch repair ATPase MutL